MADTNNKVGLAVFTTLPDSPEIVAVICRRGRWNFETDKLESYPGGCQVIAAGKVQDGEDFFQAAVREAREELGEMFVKMLGVIDKKVLVLSGVNDSNKLTYGVMVPYGVLRYIRLHPGSGGLGYIRAHEVTNIRNLKNFSKTYGVNDLTIIAMFLDEIEALKIGFERFEAEIACA